MKREHVISMVSKLLEMSDDIFSNHSCNDLPDNFFEGMTHEEIRELDKEYHDWNGDPEEHEEDPDGFLGDSMLMGFFAKNLAKLLKEQK